MPDAETSISEEPGARKGHAGICAGAVRATGRPTAMVPEQHHWRAMVRCRQRGMDRESVALSLSPDFAKIIRVARSEARRGNVFSLDEVKTGLVEATASTKSRILAARGRKRRKSRNTSRRGKIRG